MHQLHRNHRHDRPLFFKIQDDPNFPLEEYQLAIYYDPLFSDRDNASDAYNEFLFVEFDHK